MSTLRIDPKVAAVEGGGSALVPTPLLAMLGRVVELLDAGCCAHENAGEV